MDTSAMQESQDTTLLRKIKPESIDIPSDELDSQCEHANTILLFKDQTFLEAMADRILCFCDHWFWLNIVRPLLELGQLENVTLSGDVRAFKVTHCGMVACVLRVSPDTTSSGSYHWSMLSYSMWTLLLHVTQHFNLSVSHCKAVCFHPAFVSEDYFFHSMAVPCDLKVIKRTPFVGSRLSSPLDGLWLSGPAFPLLEDNFQWEFQGLLKSSDLADYVFWLMKLWSDQFGKVENSSSCVTAVGANDNLIKNEFPATSIHENLLKASEAIQDLRPKHGSLTPAQNTIRGCRRKGISVQELKRICQDYFHLFKPKRNESNSAWRKFSRGGGSPLIECPSCSEPYKGNLCDMLHLCKHIERYHKESQDFLLQCVCVEYCDKLEYMKDMIKKHAIYGYKKKLRCNSLAVKNA